MARISTAAAKAKGRKLQQIVRDKLLELHPSLTPDDVKSCPMGSNGQDLQFSTEAKRLIKYNFECKARAKIALVYDAISQANGTTDRVPIAVIKADRKAPLVVIELDAFMAILSEMT